MPFKMVREVEEDIKANIQENFKNIPIPLTFIPNKGQIDSKVKYYIKGSGYGFYFTREEVVMTFAQKSLNDNKEEGFTLDSSNDNGFSETKEESIRVAIALQFIGANPEVKIVGLEKATGKVNYFNGKDPAKWITGLSTYEKIIYKELWSGIDLVFYGMDEQLKYEFILQPEASVEYIKFSYKGADDTSLDEEGNLLIHNPLCVLIDERPISYQDIYGEKVEVVSNFAVKRQENGESIYGFEIGDTYNSNYPLVIDPGLVYSTFLGGSNFLNFGHDIAVDAKGNAFVTGEIRSLDFPVTLGAFQEVYLGGITSVFVTKINSDGSGLTYSTFLGGSGGDSARGIAVDDKGNTYVTGETRSSDFPVTLGAFQEVYPGGFSSLFVTKLNLDGTRLVYSTFLGGSNFDEGSGIAVDDKGSSYVTGSTSSFDFPVTSGVFQEENMKGPNNRTAFVTKLNSDGTRLVYSTYLGGSSFDRGNGIAVDDKRNVYVTGETESSDFPVTLGAFQEKFVKVASLGFIPDAFVVKLNSDGSRLVYSTFIGGKKFDRGNGIVVDNKGNAYVTGETRSSDFPVTLGAFQKERIGSSTALSAFVIKLNSDGTRLIYSTFLGGSNTDIGFGIAVDEKCNAYVTGGTASGDFPITLGSFQEDSGGTFRVFVTKLNSDGTRLIYSTFLGGSSSDTGRSIAVDDNENAYVTGETQSSDFPVTLGAFQKERKGEAVFVIKLNTSPIN